ncbi:hypothetical protein Tco_1091613 [Tanacetum coccineum]|uniref:Uncharacterized protein n=1 Tax=Tanacetum coccineum TaxID=301880 RepID=A0ABQ5I7I6_9ASTR
MEYLHEKFRHRHHHHVDEIDVHVMMRRRDETECCLATITSRTRQEQPYRRFAVGLALAHVDSLTKNSFPLLPLGLSSLSEDFDLSKSDGLNLNVGLINNTAFVNVAIFNGFVEFGNGRGDTGDFGYFWDVGFGKMTLRAQETCMIWLGHIGGLEGDEEGLVYVLVKLETSFDEVFTPFDAGG